MAAESKHQWRTKEIKCAFCNGTGIDPFGVPSKISLCAVCGGTGKVKVKQPFVKCAFCGGSGIHPHTRLTCTACMGKGLITVKEPNATCSVCEGSGAAISGLNLPCIECSGAGLVLQ